MYSVVIASRAGAPSVHDALDSIFQQSLPPARVEVVVDRGDPLPQGWWASIATRFPQTQLHVHPGQGMSSAVAAGIRRVSTPFVAFLDTDDVWLADKMRIQVDSLLARPALDAVTCLSVNVRRGTGEGALGRPVPAAMFTATTFRTTAFDTFGLPDCTASHFVWLYRWWSKARALGIRTETSEYLGLHRMIHADNSWIRDCRQAHGDLMTELRRTVRQRESKL